MPAGNQWDGYASADNRNFLHPIQIVFNMTECKCKIDVQYTLLFINITKVLNTELVAKLLATAFVVKLADHPWASAGEGKGGTCFPRNTKQGIFLGN